MVISKMNHIVVEPLYCAHNLRSTLIKAACMQYNRWLNYRDPLYATYRDPVTEIPLYTRPCEHYLRLQACTLTYPSSMLLKCFSLGL